MKSKTVEKDFFSILFFIKDTPASRLIKNLPVPLGTLVRKRARLKPAGGYIVCYITRPRFMFTRYNMGEDEQCSTAASSLP